MKQQPLILTVLMLLFAAVLSAQNPHTVAFYNVENFYDTLDDPTSEDDDFTPNGRYEWTQDRYDLKLSNIERVLHDIALANDRFPAIIALAEVECRAVLDDIVSTPKLASAGYCIVHYDSPDVRGIDVALLYRPDVFQLYGSSSVTTIIPQQPDFRTRDMLTVWGTIEDEELFFIVAHWPSRRGGSEKSEYLRSAAAAQMRQVVDSVKILRPKSKFILMGDFNDDPCDASISEVLGAKAEVDSLATEGFYNPYYDMLMAGYGTLAYDGVWNIFDNIIVSTNLTYASGNEGLKLQRSINNERFWGDIFKPDYLIQQDGRYRGYPFRTFSGTKFMGGYSDHLPVYINID
ncbi:MAG: endonuclease/exonuclease/phosphatase family protein [Rikenellaceae bacterium]